MAPAALSPSAAEEGHSSWRARSEERKEEYIRSINTLDVCALASYYHGSQPCAEFREHKRGSHNVCYFIEFPNDRTRWVVRFPLTSVLQDAHRKLDSEIATMEFYAHLADFHSQMRGLEFDAAGALTLGPDGTFKITAPLPMDIAAMESRGDYPESWLKMTTTLESYTDQMYALLLRRAAEPVPEMGLLDVQYLIFALQDFESRMQEFASSSPKHKFVLTHGDLQPSNIILGEDFSIKGIIDWEWAGTVPAPFFVPPLWLGKNIAPVANDDDFRNSFFSIRNALAVGDSKLTREWPENLYCSTKYFIPAALLNQQFFMTVYYTQLFPIYFGEAQQHVKVRQFFQDDGPDGIHSRRVASLMRARPPKSRRALASHCTAVPKILRFRVSTEEHRRNNQTPEPMNSLKRRAEEAAPENTNKKKRKNKFSAEDKSLDTELGLNMLFSRMDNQLLADYLAQKLGRFGTDLSPVELSDMTVSGTAITDSTDFTEQRTLEKLPDFLGHFCKNPDSLAKASKKKGNPHSIIVTGAGLRAADIVRAVRKFASKEIAVAKLFAKHMKVDEQVKFLEKMRVSIAVGTPARLSELIDNGMCP
ncbi:hypothetical protein LLEC1_04861 [Akanthomyces lecanii]|uniref:Aminoglycoside phosphotransferase domain-containing protein n=1 Tax=Cordyceps confragosa TaxID=2714763 RepID=A0A179I9J1_CORDF|nr:hypothetical protein LLEC1_04861 [Akanthomyces lecanii]